MFQSKEAGLKKVVVALGVALALGSCSDPVCGCPPIGSATWAVIEGTVVDSQADAVQDAQVRAIGSARLECGTDTSRLDGDPDPATTDAEGHFTMTLWSQGVPGPHCVDLEITSSASSAADTVRDVEVPFLWDYMGADTLSLPLTVSW